MTDIKIAQSCYPSFLLAGQRSRGRIEKDSMVKDSMSKDTMKKER